MPLCTPKHLRRSSLSHRVLSLSFFMLFILSSLFSSPSRRTVRSTCPPPSFSLGPPPSFSLCPPPSFSLCPLPRSADRRNRPRGRGPCKNRRSTGVAISEPIRGSPPVDLVAVFCRPGFRHVFLRDATISLSVRHTTIWHFSFGSIEWHMVAFVESHVGARVAFTKTKRLFRFFFLVRNAIPLFIYKLHSLTLSLSRAHNMLLVIM